MAVQLLERAIETHLEWRLARNPEIKDWVEQGVVLGALGGLCGFFTSGLVHPIASRSRLIVC